MSRKYPAMTDADLIGLLKAGEYSVNTDTGAVHRNGSPFPLATFGPGQRRFVRLHWKGGRRGIAVSRLVWLSVVLTPIPEGFEVHHRDLTCWHDNWENLICLHKLDHRKLHARLPDLEPVPF